MARHRQRARERKLQQPHRENVPGELEHASADVDEVEASIIAGAGGEPLAEDEATEFDAFGRSAEDEPELSEEEIEAVVEEEEEREDAVDTRRSARRRRAARERAAERPERAPRRQRTGAIAFLRASWAELQRVQWPDRKQVAQATAVVLGFVAIAGAYLGIADSVAQKLVNLII